MSLYVATTLAVLISLAAIAGAFYFLKSRAITSIESQKANLLQALEEEEVRLKEMVDKVDAFASRGQLEFLSKQIESVQSELGKEKLTLDNIEEKLDVAQKAVEEKESKQQDLRVRKEEEEEDLDAVLEIYKTLSDESVALEQKLAASLKRVDELLEAARLEGDHKGVLDDFSEVMTQSGARLRDLITEYQNLNDKLSALRQQHSDLEEEYTKLVERQLGA